MYKQLQTEKRKRKKTKKKKETANFGKTVQCSRTLVKE